jgi:hypothetical protein
VPIYQLAQATPQKTLNLFNNATWTSDLTFKPVSQQIQTRCYLNHPARYNGHHLIHTHYQNEFLIQAPMYLPMSHTSLQECVSILPSKYQDHFQLLLLASLHISNYTFALMYRVQLCWPAIKLSATRWWILLPC